MDKRTLNSFSVKFLKANLLLLLSFFLPLCIIDTDKHMHSDMGFNLDLDCVLHVSYFMFYFKLQA